MAATDMPGFSICRHCPPSDRFRQISVIGDTLPAMADVESTHNRDLQTIDSPPARPPTRVDEPHIEDMSTTSPEDERVAELLADESFDPIELADAIEQQEAADAADSL